jgi:hypothetical protein
MSIAIEELEFNSQQGKRISSLLHRYSDGLSGPTRLLFSRYCRFFP